jgi:hypothetical protein
MVVLAVSAVCMFAFTSTSAFAVDQLFTGTAGVELRDVNTPTAYQPSAIELVATETTKLEIPGVNTSECTEGEFGAFVTENKGVTDPAEDPTISVPFGVFENCTLLTGGANAPVYVDTEGAVNSSQITAVINDDGAPNPINVVLKHLEISLYIKGATETTICKFGGSGPAGTITGAWTNGAGPFTEEASTNQTMVDFKGQELSGNCNGTALKASIKSAKFFVETTSDAKDFSGNSDTVFYKI